MSLLGISKMSAPDLGLRVSALKMQKGQQLNAKELKRFAARQWNERDANKVAANASANSYDNWKAKNFGAFAPDAPLNGVNRLGMDSNGGAMDGSLRDLFSPSMSPRAQMTEANTAAAREGDMRGRFGDAQFGQALNRTNAALGIDAGRLANVAAGDNIDFNRQQRPLALDARRLANVAAGDNIDFNRQQRPLALDARRLANVAANETIDFNRQQRPLVIQGMALANRGREQDIDWRQINTDRLRKAESESQAGKFALVNVANEEAEIAKIPLYLRNDETRFANPLADGIAAAARNQNFGAFSALTKEAASRSSSAMKNAKDAASIQYRQSRIDNQQIKNRQESFQVSKQEEDWAVDYLVKQNKALLLGQKIQAAQKKFDENERSLMAEGIIARAYQNGSMDDRSFQNLLEISPALAMKFAKENNIRSFDYTDSDGKKKNVNLIGDKIIYGKEQQQSAFERYASGVKTNSNPQQSSAKNAMQSKYGE